MRYAPAVLLGTALLGLAAPARADQIPWSYSWSRTPNVIYADGSTASYVTLSDASQTETPGAAGPIQATNVFTYGGSPNGPPAEFTDKPFTLTLNLFDPTVAQPGSVSFAGDLFGYLTPTNGHITTFYAGPTTKSLTLGKHLYTITLDAYSPSGPDCTTPQVTAVASISVQTLPEPTAAVLAGLALSAGGLFWLRRRRRT